MLACYFFKKVKAQINLLLQKATLRGTVRIILLSDDDKVELH